MDACEAPYHWALLLYTRNLFSATSLRENLAELNREHGLCGQNHISRVVKN